MFQHSPGAGSDVVLFGISLPSDTVVNNVRAQVHVYDPGIASLAVAGIYAVEGWILPVLDVDAGLNFDTIWDALVPKDTDVEAMDLDTAASDTTPFYEPGEIDWTAIFDVGLRPERVFSRKKIITPMNTMGFQRQDTETPFANGYVMGDRFNINIRKRLRVRQPSILVFGFAAPSLDDTTNSETESLAALPEAAWGQVKYMGHVLERAMLHVLGITEAGAETPWEEATAILKQHLDPDVFEADATSWAAAAWTIFGEATIDHSVKGRLGRSVVTTGR